MSFALTAGGTEQRTNNNNNSSPLSCLPETVSEEEDSFPFPELRVRLENKFNTTIHNCLEGELEYPEKTYHTGFYSCYLLRSLSEHPYGKNRTYIGFTVDPARRLRQHNGDLKAGGAWRTKSFRPWQMVLVIYGFHTKTEALQFEWAWQHPTKTRALKPMNNTLPDYKNGKETKNKRSGKVPLGISGKVKTLIDLVCSSQWSSHTLTVTFLEEAIVDCSELLFKTSQLPLNVQTNILSLKELDSLKESTKKPRPCCQESCQNVTVEKNEKVTEKLDTTYCFSRKEMEIFDISSTDSDDPQSDSLEDEDIISTDCFMETPTKAQDNLKSGYENEISDHLQLLGLTSTPKKENIDLSCKNQLNNSRRNDICSPDCPSCSRYCSKRRITEK